MKSFDQKSIGIHINLTILQIELNAPVYSHFVSNRIYWFYCCIRKIELPNYQYFAAQYFMKTIGWGVIRN